jgi:H+/Cl- antiporter ClcA
MVIVGVIMLLPGLCALIFASAALTERSFPSDFVPFIVVGLLVGFVGVMLIRAAFRGPRS